MVNIVLLVGAVGRNPEHVSIKDGANQLAHFSLATESPKLVDEKWRNEIEWHFIEVWGAGAKNVMKFVKKGCVVMVYGTIYTAKYTNNEGKRTEFKKIIASGFRVLKYPGEEMEEPGYMKVPDEFKED